MKVKKYIVSTLQDSLKILVNLSTIAISKMNQPLRCPVDVLLFYLVTVTNQTSNLRIWKIVNLIIFVFFYLCLVIPLYKLSHSDLPSSPKI